MDTPAAPAPDPSAGTASPPDPYGSLTHFGAVDWARGHHDVRVVGAAGRVVLELRIEDTPEGWADLRQRLAALKAPDGSAPAVASASRSRPAPDRPSSGCWRRNTACSR
ncbi:MAG TPA: hypothetical protein VGI81_18075 [Tepidisphaeraceae bacterium]|jgi:hypothetical protein